MLLLAPGLLALALLPGHGWSSSTSSARVQRPARCPAPCTSHDPSAWYVYSSASRVSQCNETMILDFNIHNALNNTQSHSTIRTCTTDSRELAQLVSDTDALGSAKSTNISVTSHFVGWEASGSGDLSNNSTGLLTDLKLYLTGNPHKSEIFGYSQGTAAGVYLGASLQRAENVEYMFDQFLDFVDNTSYAVSAFQYCGRDSNHTFGVVLDRTGDLAAVQKHVQAWYSSDCASGADSTLSIAGSVWITSPFSDNTTVTSNSTFTRRSLDRLRTGHKHSSGSHSHLHRHKRSSSCSYVTVVSGDTCTTLVSECGITATEFYEYNTASDLCSTLAVGQLICCSSGSLPDLSPSANSNGTCYTYYVQSGDSCSALASTYSLTVDEIDTYNNATWGWYGCDDLQAGQSICLSTGNPPYPTVVANAQCGPQVENTTFTSEDSSQWGDLNPCPLNACCDTWGQCGTTPLYCNYTESSTNSPGTAAAGTNGCISNCGTTITNWANPPSSYAAIGYYEASSVNRSCLAMSASSIDTSQWTHLNFAFGNIASDYSINVDGMEDQFSQFVELSNVKRLISFGGWDFSTDTDTYSIFRDGVKSANRATLAQNVANFISETGLDGVDFDWEYPGEPDIPGIPAGSDDEGDNYLAFLQAVRDALPSDALLSVTLPSSYWYLKAFPVYNMSLVVDYFNYMTYDLHGTWDEGNDSAQWGCTAGNCLFSHVNMTETMWALAMLTKADVETAQIMVGVSSYGRSFEMTTAGCYSSDCTWDAAGAAGECTDTAGYISNAEINDILTYSASAQLISTNVTDILVYNETQWVGYMTNETKVSRRATYEGYNFGGTMEWAVDLEEFVLSGSDSSSSSSSDSSSCSSEDESGGETITIDPTVWAEATPAVTCSPPCYMVMPPLPLSTTTTISFEDWYTQIYWRATETVTTTFQDGSVTTFASYSSYSIPTIISISPVATDYIEVWNQQITAGQTAVYQTSSVEPSPFPITFTPTIGGTTTITGGTTSTFPALTFSSGCYSYTRPAWTGVFGGTTVVVDGTTLSPTTSSVTPQPYPTTTGGHDSALNTRTTTVHANTKSGSSGPKATGGGSDGHSGTHCLVFCHGCPFCPPGAFSDDDSSGGDSSAGGGGDDSSSSGSSSGSGDDNDSSSSSSSSSTSTGSYLTAAGAGMTVEWDPVVTATDAAADVAAVATAIGVELNNLYGAEQSSLTAGAYSSIYATAGALCTLKDDSYCSCSGSSEKYATTSGSAGACGYVATPTKTVSVMTSTSVIDTTITHTSIFSSTYGYINLAAASYYEVVDEVGGGGANLNRRAYGTEVHQYDLHWVSATATSATLDYCDVGWAEAVGQAASPTPTTWAAVPETVAFTGSLTLPDGVYSGCFFTSSAGAALPELGCGTSLLLGCDTYVSTSTIDCGSTSMAPLASCVWDGLVTEVLITPTQSTTTITAYYS